MLKETLIFSVGVVVGILVSFAINGYEIDINVNHNINLPTGIVIGGPQAKNEDRRINLMLNKMQYI